MEQITAPIVLFVYNRIEHTIATIEALKRNVLADRSDLYIYSDAAKTEAEITKVATVREYINGIIGFKSVNIVERTKNMGLAESVISGVTDIVNRFGSIIVLEDDIVTDNSFLTYMNQALSRYKNETRVFSITGYSLTTKSRSDKVDDFYFIKTGDCWSWATWADRWQYFDKDAYGWEELTTNNKLRYEFNFSNACDYYNMLKSQMEHKIDSWAIRWYWSVFKHNGLTLYPRESIISNIGLDGSGTHCGEEDIKANIIVPHKLSFQFPIDIEQKQKNRDAMIKEMRKQNPTIFARIKKRIRKMNR